MGKKKGGQNAFFFFMMDLKNKQGNSYKSMDEVCKAADPLWKRMTPEQRKPYELKAKQSKQGTKYTSDGVDINVITRRENEMYDKEQKAKQEIQNSIKRLYQFNHLREQHFYIMHVNNFCYSNSNRRYYPAEIAVARFNLEDGVILDDVFHYLVKPGPLPLGYSFAAKKSSEESHQIPIPNDDETENNTEEIFNSLIAYLTKIPSEIYDFPPVYAREKDIELISNILSMYCYDFGEREDIFNVYSLEYLLYTLKNTCAESPVFQFISMSASEIDRDCYDYTKDISCEYHSVTFVPVHCSKSIVTRLAYIICENCSPYLDIQLIPSQHIPIDVKPAFTVNTEETRSVSVTSNITHEAAGGPLDEYDTESVRSESAYSLSSDQFPSMRGSRYTGTDTEDDNGWQTQKPRSGHGVMRGRRPFELPSALAQRSAENNFPALRGRGRGRNLASGSSQK